MIFNIILKIQIKKSYSIFKSNKYGTIFPCEYIKAVVCLRQPFNIPIIKAYILLNGISY